MTMMFNDVGWTTLQRKHALVELTPGELRALHAAATYGLAHDSGEQRELFGSMPAVAALERAQARLHDAADALGCDL